MLDVADLFQLHHSAVARNIKRKCILDKDVKHHECLRSLGSLSHRGATEGNCLAPALTELRFVAQSAETWVIAKGTTDLRLEK